MRAVVQRARDAKCEVNGEITGAFDGSGLVVLVGVTHADTLQIAQKMAHKIAKQRIFAAPEAARGTEMSALDLGLPVLIISQFTLYGDTRKGNRPSWVAAAPGDVAKPLVEAVACELESLGMRVETGIFGANMQVSFTNDGPFTVLIEI